MDISTAKMLLDVDADPSKEDIKNSYRELVTDEHPDQSEAEDATERFKRINEAKELLITEIESEADQQSQNNVSDDAESAKNSRTYSDSQTRGTSRGTESNKKRNRADGQKTYQTESSGAKNSNTNNSTSSQSRYSEQRQREGTDYTDKASSVENQSDSATGQQTPVSVAVLGFASISNIAIPLGLPLSRSGYSVPVFSGMGYLEWGGIWFFAAILLGISYHYYGVDLLGRSGAVVVAFWPVIAAVAIVLLDILFQITDLVGGIIILIVCLPGIAGLLLSIRDVMNPLRTMAENNK